MGFLPMPTTVGDRIFITVVLFIAIHLLWMRFLEQYLPLLVATAVSLVIGFFIIKYG